MASCVERPGGQVSRSSWAIRSYSSHPIETAFSDREKDLAQRSQHLSPGVLATELDHIAAGHHYPIYITHTKPAETGLIMQEIQRFDETPNRQADVRHDIRWLSAGQTFEL